MKIKIHLSCEVWEIWQWEGGVVLVLKKVRNYRYIRDGPWSPTSGFKSWLLLSSWGSVKWAWNPLPHRSLWRQEPRAVTVSLGWISLFIHLINKYQQASLGTVDTMMSLQRFPLLTMAESSGEHREERHHHHSGPNTRTGSPGAVHETDGWPEYKQDRARPRLRHSYEI